MKNRVELNKIVSGCAVNVLRNIYKVMAKTIIRDRMVKGKYSFGMTGHAIASEAEITTDLVGNSIIIDRVMFKSIYTEVLTSETLTTDNIPSIDAESLFLPFEACLNVRVIAHYTNEIFCKNA